MRTTFMTDASIKLAEIALNADGQTPRSMGGEFYFNEAKNNLANVIGELWQYVPNARIVALVDQNGGKQGFAVYAGDFKLTEQATAVRAFEQSHSDYTPCEILG